MSFDAFRSSVSYLVVDMLALLDCDTKSLFVFCWSLAMSLLCFFILDLSVCGQVIVLVLIFVHYSTKVLRL